MIRLLHTADWQIGKPYRWVHDPLKRFRLQEERIRAIARLGAVARQRQAALVLVAGDLFDSPTVPPSAVLDVLEAIGSIEVPLLVIPGNHDHGAPGSLWHRQDLERERRRRAPNLTLLLKREPLELDQAVLLPCPLLRRSESGDPTAWIRALDLGALPAAKPRLVLAHGSVHGFSARDYGGDPEVRASTGNQLDLARLPADAIDYIALGDWHNLKQVSERTWYSGTPEPDRFDQGEGNLRGQVLLVEAERGGLPRVEPVSTGRLRWHNRLVRFEGDESLDRLESDLAALIGDRVSADLLRLELSGSLSLSAHQRFDQLCEALGHQLLELRLRGRCDRTPRDQELEALTRRPGDPLIARVAGELQARLVEREEEGDDEAARIARQALCELYALTMDG